MEEAQKRLKEAKESPTRADFRLNHAADALERVQRPFLIDQQKEELDQPDYREEMTKQEFKNLASRYGIMKIELGLATPEEIKERRIASTERKLKLSEKRRQRS